MKQWNEKKTKRGKRDNDHLPSQKLDSTVQGPRVSSDGIVTGGPVRRPKRSRRVVEECPSDLETDTIEVNTQQRGSHTPVLDSDPASTPGDDFDPDSPSLEILESQHQASAAPDFSLQIPTKDIDKADYESFHSSQIPYSVKSPLSAATVSEQRSLRSSAKLNRPAVPSPLTQASSGVLEAAHQRLLNAVDSSSPLSPSSSRRKVQVSASSDTNNHLAGLPVSQPNLASQVVESSLATSSTRSVDHQASQASSSLRKSTANRQRIPNTLQTLCRHHNSGANQAFSSSQRSSQLPLSQKSGLSKALQSLDRGDLVSQSSPWQFQSQFVPPAVFSQPKSNLEKASNRRPKRSSVTAGEFNSQSGSEIPSSSHTSRQKSRNKMDLPAVRQSPRLRASTPVKGVQSPRLAPEEQTLRARTAQIGEESASPQEARILGNAPSLSVQDYSDGSYDGRSKPTPTPSFASVQAYAHEPNLPVETSPQQHVYDPAVGRSALPIQQSIEDELSSSPEEASFASKASSSQASLDNERAVPQVDGVSLPVQPVLGPAEYTIALPAEGKIQSAYADTIKAKRKMILKFVNRRDSVGSANGSNSRTMERNEMIELIERLNDTTTHFDLGLPGFATQYTVRSKEHAAFAQYAGAKFVFLDCLVEALTNVDCSVVIASKPGPVQHLIEEFLVMKHIHVTKHDRPTSARSTTPDYHQQTLKIDLLDTSSDIDIRLSSRPVLLIAFDTSFDNQSPQIKRIRELNSRGRNQLLPVVHLLTSNSSEHIDICLRKTMPSPQRLKLLVRGTYQAKANLGGSPTYVPDPSDEPEGRQMDIHDLQRAVRKSPNRKLNMMAHIVARAAVAEDFEQYWSLGPMPEVQYDELEDTPPELSERSTAAGTAVPTPRDGRARSRTPLSRAGTPSGKKRLLDPDDVRIQSVLSKRQRMSPLRDITPVQEPPREQVNELEQMREQVKNLQAELTTEKQARLKAQADLELEKTRSADWEKSHNTIMHRYDLRRVKQHKLDKENKRLHELIDSGKEKQEKVTQSNTSLKEQVAQLKTELNTAREELKESTVPELAALEAARSQAREAAAKAVSFGKQLENKNQDFEFTRQQYQQASTRAAELGQQNMELEAQVDVLKVQASEETRRLREINLVQATKQDLERIDQLEQEKKGMEKILKKMREDMEVFRKGRGVQTRGSSVQPPGSPGMVGVGTRSRQGSPAPGHVLTSAADARNSHAVNRVSELRNERS